MSGYLTLPVGARIGDKTYAFATDNAGKINALPSPPAPDVGKYITGTAGANGAIAFQGLQLSCVKAAASENLACTLEQNDASGKNILQAAAVGAVAGAAASTVVQPPNMFANQQTDSSANSNSALWVFLLIILVIIIVAGVFWYWKNRDKMIVSKEKPQVKQQ